MSLTLLISCQTQKIPTNVHWDMPVCTSIAVILNKKKTWGFFALAAGHVCYDPTSHLRYRSEGECRTRTERASRVNIVYAAARDVTDRRDFMLVLSSRPYVARQQEKYRWQTQTSGRRWVRMFPCCFTDKDQREQEKHFILEGFFGVGLNYFQLLGLFLFYMTQTYNVFVFLAFFCVCFGVELAVCHCCWLLTLLLILSLITGGRKASHFEVTQKHMTATNIRYLRKEGWDLPVHCGPYFCKWKYHKYHHVFSTWSFRRCWQFFVQLWKSKELLNFTGNWRESQMFS